MVQGVLLAAAFAGGACGSFASAASGDADASAPGDGGTTEAKDAIDDVDAKSTPDLNVGLLAHWKLDDTGDIASDALGENPGNRIDGAWTAGRLGGAFSTGGSGYVTVPWTEKLNAPERFTLTAWLNLDLKVDGDSFVFTHGSSFYVKLNGRQPQLGMGNGVNYNVTREVPAGGWHHLAVAFDAGAPAIYVDGILGGADLNTMPPTARPNGGTNPISIGCGNGAVNFSVGSIDDVRFYARVLSTEQIKALAAAQ